jgi:hypothetical protein
VGSTKKQATTKLGNNDEFQSDVYLGEDEANRVTKPTDKIEDHKKS